MQSTGVADMSIQLADVCVLAAGWLLGVMWATYEVRMEERRREIDGPEEAQRENGEEGERETGEEGEGEETERDTDRPTENERDTDRPTENERDTDRPTENERDTDRPTENERDSNAQTQLITPTSWYCGWG